MTTTTTCRRRRTESLRRSNFEAAFLAKVGSPFLRLRPRSEKRLASEYVRLALWLAYLLADPAAQSSVPGAPEIFSEEKTV